MISNTTWGILQSFLVLSWLAGWLKYKLSKHMYSTKEAFIKIKKSVAIVQNLWKIQKKSYGKFQKKITPASSKSVSKLQEIWRSEQPFLLPPFWQICKSFFVCPDPCRIEFIVRIFYFHLFNFPTFSRYSSKAIEMSFLTSPYKVYEQ